MFTKSQILANIIIGLILVTPGISRADPYYCVGLLNSIGWWVPDDRSGINPFFAYVHLESYLAGKSNDGRNGGLDVNKDFLYLKITKMAFDVAVVVAVDRQLAVPAGVEIYKNYCLESQARLSKRTRIVDRLAQFSDPDIRKKLLVKGVTIADLSENITAKMAGLDYLNKDPQYLNDSIQLMIDDKYSRALRGVFIEFRPIPNSKGSKSLFVQNKGDSFVKFFVNCMIFREDRLMNIGFKLSPGDSEEIGPTNGAPDGFSRGDGCWIYTLDYVVSRISLK